MKILQLLMITLVISVLTTHVKYLLKFVIRTNEVVKKLSNSEMLIIGLITLCLITSESSCVSYNCCVRIRALLHAFNARKTARTEPPVGCYGYSRHSNTSLAELINITGI